MQKKSYKNLIFAQLPLFLFPPPINAKNRIDA